MRPLRIAAALLVCAAPLPGCASVDRYMRDRLLDVTDVLDFKYGDAAGLGVKVEATMYLGTGLGFGVVDSSREWFGRRSVWFDRSDGSLWTGDGLFLHAGFIGLDGGRPGDAAQTSVNAIFVNGALFWWSGGPPMIDRFRFGGVLLLPGAIGGLYLNVGELCDFFAGLVGEDPAHDDGLAKE